MAMLDKLRGFLGGGVADRPVAGSQFMRGEASPFFFNWRPQLRDGRQDVRESWQLAAARAVDTLHNSGWLAGAIDQAIGTTIGTGLRLASRPDADALGWDQAKADAWAALVERRWEAWADCPAECDAGGRWTMAQLQDQVLRSHFAQGEAVATLPFIRRAGSQTGTKVMLIPAHRIVNQSDNLARIFQGVRLDPYGRAIGYRIARPVDDGVDPQFAPFVDLPAFDLFGRPQVLHVFEAGDIGRVRGITPLAPVLKVMRQYDQLADATLTASLLQALFAATVKSDAPTPEILQALQDPEEIGVTGEMDNYLGAKAAWYKSTKIDLGTAGRIAHLFPGEELEFHSSEHPNSTYEQFVRWLLREIAKCLGMTFEELTGDFTGATYSSVRMATAHNWPLVMRRRKNIPGRFSDIVFDAWLEEQVDMGLIPFDGGIDAFVQNRAAATRCEWRGPAKPQADDVKAATAQEKWKKLGIMSDERICADLGYDWETEYQQIAREREYAKKLELPDNLMLSFMAAPEQNPEPAPSKVDG